MKKIYPLDNYKNEMVNNVKSFQLKVTSYNILADAYTRHLDD